MNKKSTIKVPRVELPFVPASDDDLKLANIKVVKRLKANTDNKDFTPLTLHNAVHSFESFFFQYSFWLKATPEVIFDFGVLKFKWGRLLEIWCNGANFYIYRYNGPNKELNLVSSNRDAPALWERRDKVMQKLEKLAGEHKFPVGPC